MDFEALVPDTSESEEGSPIQSWGIARSVPETTSEESQTEEEAVALCSGGLAAYDDDDNPELSPSLAPREDPPNGGRHRFFLATYSKADLEKCPSRKAFAEILSAGFSSVAGGRDNIAYWAVSLEPHAVDGVHYHASLMMNTTRRYKAVARRIKEEYEINVWFREGYTTYFDAFSYVKKTDKYYVTSDNHPVLDNSPPKNIRRALETRKRSNSDSNKQEKSINKKKKNPPRLRNPDVEKIIVDNSLTTELQLAAFAEEQSELGKKDLSDWYVSRTDKQVTELIDRVWRKKNARAMLERKKMTRWQLMEDALKGDCTSEGCRWLPMAEEVLRNNNIDKNEFRSSVKELLLKGRGKGRNLYLHGPSNCGKTFLLRPLSRVFKVFANPPSSTFNWVGANEAEVVFLNDFRYSENVLCWSDMLNLLEGHLIMISMPKNTNSKDVEWKEDTPIFATAAAPMSRVVGGQLLDSETTMIQNRWKHFQFTKAMSEEAIVEQPPCGRCFAHFICL